MLAFERQWQEPCFKLFRRCKTQQGHCPRGQLWLSHLLRVLVTLLWHQRHHRKRSKNITYLGRYWPWTLMSACSENHRLPSGAGSPGPVLKLTITFENMIRSCKWLSVNTHKILGICKMLDTYRSQLEHLDYNWSKKRERVKEVYTSHVCFSVFPEIQIGCRFG